MNTQIILHDLKKIKALAPVIFQDKTPSFHLKLYDFVVNCNDRYKIILCFRGASKTTIGTKVGIFTKIMKKQCSNVMIVADTRDKAIKFLQDVYALFSRAKEYHLGAITNIDFKGRNLSFKLDNQNIFIDTLGATQDPRGSAKDFKRPDLVVLDDLQSKTGRYPVGNFKHRELLYEWFNADLLPSLAPNGEVLFFGTMIHEDCVLARLLKSELWNSFTQAIINEDNTSAWASRYPLDAILKIKKDFDANNSSHIFYQEYMCLPYDSENPLFSPRDFRYFDCVLYSDRLSVVTYGDEINEKKLYIKEPIGIKLEDGEIINKDDCLCYSMTDISSGDTIKKGDDCAIVTIWVHNNIWYVVDIRAYPMNVFNRCCECISVIKTFNPIKFGMEGGGMQNDFRYILKNALRSVNENKFITKLTANKSKNSRIVTLMPLFCNHKIYFNRSAIETAKLGAQLVSFIESFESRDDDIMDALAYGLRIIRGVAFSNYELAVYKDSQREAQEAIHNAMY